VIEATTEANEILVLNNTANTECKILTFAFRYSPVKQYINASRFITR